MPSSLHNGGNRNRARFAPTLRVKLEVSFTLIFIGVLGLVEAAGYYGVPFTALDGWKNQQREEVWQSLNMVADMKKDRLLEWIQEIRDTTYLIAGNEGVVSQVRDISQSLQRLSPDGISDAEGWSQIKGEESYQSLVRYLHTVQATFDEFASISIADPQTGRVIAATDPQKTGLNSTATNYLAETLESKDFYIEDIAYDQFSRQPAVYFSQAIKDENGAAIGVLLIEVETSISLPDFLHTGAGLGESGEVVLVNGEGMILASLKHPLPDGSTATILDYQIEARPALLAASGEEGIIETNDYRGVPVLAAYRHIRVSPTIGWGLVVKRDQAEVFAPLRERILFSLLIGAAGSILIILLTIRIAETITRPLRKLSDTAESVARGELNARAPVVTPDEVGRLAMTFNTMVQKVQNWHEELEQQIEARTADLNAMNLKLRMENSERERAEEAKSRLNKKLLDKNQDLEQIIHIASHDLRSPLVNIQGFSKELEEAFDTLISLIDLEEIPPARQAEVASLIDSEIPEAFQYIFTSTHKMNSLLSGLLRLSRVGKATLTLTPIDMNALIEKVLETMEFQMKRAGISSEVASLPNCYGDTMLISQVFSNLIDNAIKYTSPDRPGLIRITGSIENGQVIYCVEDNGIGIKKEYQHKIYDIFHRLDPRQGSGEGLGLTITRRIVDRHGGKIWLESEPGAGSKFYIAFHQYQLSSPAGDE